MIIIPLGCDCNISFKLQKLGIKQENSIFEWWASTNLKDVVFILEKILMCQTPEIDGPNNTIWPGNHIFKGADIRTAHYINKSGEGSLEYIIPRRCERLRKQLMTTENVLFIRENQGNYSYTYDIEVLRYFKRVIEKYNPSLKYKLLNINYHAHIFGECDIPEIIHCYHHDSLYYQHIYNCFNEHPPKMCSIITDATI